MVNTYTDAGQLMCILCKTVIRNETVWPVHLNSKSHKENITLAKKTKLETDIPKTIVQTFKRPTSPSQETSANKKLKGILKNSSTHSTQAVSSLPSDFFDNAAKKSNGNIPSNASVAVQRLQNDKTKVNNKDSKSVEIEEEKEKSKDINQTVLPEGFFDDPILDAKVRIFKKKTLLSIEHRIVYLSWEF